MERLPSTTVLADLRTSAVPASDAMYTLTNAHVCRDINSENINLFFLIFDKLFVQNTIHFEAL